MRSLPVCEPLGQRCGVLIRRPEQGSLSDLHADFLIPLFRSYGLVLFRGFQAGPAEFDALAKRFTATHFIGYGRAPFAAFPAITSVNETNLPLEPHCDNGIRPEPQRPDITWFLCETPAQTAGETTVFDGVQVWAKLSAATQELLSSQRIRFLSTYARPAWQGMGFPDAASFARFVQTVAGIPKRIGTDGTVEVEVLSSAVRRTRYGNQLTFISSMFLAGAKGFEAMQVSLEGDTEIPAHLTTELRAALADCCELIAWQAGDVAMLDNTRFLHGRRGFDDLRRRLYLIQTLTANF